MANSVQSLKTDQEYLSFFAILLISRNAWFIYVKIPLK